MHKKIDLTGKNIDGSFVIRELNPIEKKYKNRIIRKSQWLCKCSCGKEFIASLQKLLKHEIKVVSCGCKNYSEDHKNRKHKDPKKISYNAMANKYKQCANQRKIIFNLDKDTCKKLFSDNCKYCGIEPSNKYNVYITKTGNYRKGIKDWMEQAWISVKFKAVYSNFFAHK